MQLLIFTTFIAIALAKGELIQVLRVFMVIQGQYGTNMFMANTLGTVSLL